MLINLGGFKQLPLHLLNALRERTKRALRNKMHLDCASIVTYQMLYTRAILLNKNATESDSFCCALCKGNARIGTDRTPIGPCSRWLEVLEGVLCRGWRGQLTRQVTFS